MATVQTGIATDLITFSRTSNATLTDSDGLIKWAPHNLLLASEQFDSASWTKTSITPTANAVAAPNGTTTADTLTASGANGTTLQSYTSLGVSYTFGIWLKRKTGTGNIQIAADSGTYTTVTITSDWALYTVTQTPAAGTISAGIRIVTSADAVEAWGAHLYRSDLGGMKANTSAYPTYNPTTPKNLLGFTQSFDNAAWTKGGLVTTGMANVTATTDPLGGNTADKLIWENAATANGYVAQISTDRGTVANPIVSFNLNTGVSTILSGGSAISSSGATNMGNGWWLCYFVDSAAGQKFSVYAKAAEFNLVELQAYGSNRYIYVRDSVITTGNGTSGIYVWGAQLSDSASIDPYVPNYGAAPTAAAYYGPRLDFDGSTLAAKGLLVEEARANLLTYSSGFNNWAKANMTDTPDQAAAPDGTITADTVAAITTGTFRYAYQSPTLTTGTTYTLSVYFKTKTAQWIWLLGETSGDAIAYFDIVNGVLGTVGAGLTASPPQSAGNGWFRCAITFTVTSATGAQQIGFGISDSDSTSSVTAGKDVYAWGAQLEANASFATSYIPTGATTAGATRNADVASVSTQAFPYSASEGSVVVNLQHMTSPSPANQAHWQILGAGNILGTDRYQSSTSMAVRGLGLSVDTGKTLTTNVAKVGTSFTTTEVNLLINGGTAYTNTSASGTLSGATSLQIGNTSTAYQLNGWVRQLTYLPRKLSVAELQTRTA